MADEGRVLTKADKAYTLDKWHDLVDEDEDVWCGICGDRFDVGQKVIEIPAGLDNPRWVITVHLGCAVNNGEVEF